jgi:signal peptide peptidase SppA
VLKFGRPVLTHLNCIIAKNNLLGIAMNEIWFGSEASYFEAKSSIEKYTAHMSTPAGQAYMSDDEEDDGTTAPYLSVIDNVGLITIQGPLADATFGYWGPIFGITGYGDIQEALVAATRNPDVKSIMLVIKSGGGAVFGVSETAKFIQNVDKVKPIIAYSPSAMASAALWLGVAARETYVSTTTIAGSIGTIMVMMSRYEQLKQDGIDAVVVRSGKFKALGHPAEPISDAAVEIAQAQADYLSSIFLNYVAERRGVSTVAADTKFGQGREFIGEQAVAVGLVDGLKSYTEAFITTKSKFIPANNSTVVGATIADSTANADNANHLEGTNMPRPTHIPTPEELAAMAAGIDLSAEAATDEASNATGENPTTETQASTGESPTAEADTRVAELQALMDASAAAQAELQSKFDAAQAEIAAIKAEQESSAAVMSAMSDIVRGTIKTMSLPLNLATDTLAELNGSALCAKHKETADLFKSKVKAGGVAAATRQQREEETTQAAVVNPLFVAAAKLNSQKGK